LHLDREFYYGGDDIWYKAYLLNGQVNQLLNTSNNLYVELIAPNAFIVDRKVIRLEEGTGYGDFKLKDSIAPGTYRIRAYTNWMKNFGDNFVFEKKIEVGNNVVVPAKSPATSVSKNTAPSKESSSKGVIRFFPEGGSMVEGVAGIVAFKAENALGQGLKVKGSIIATSGDTITSFESKESGIGAFMLMPVAGVKYMVKGTFEGKESFISTLPEALKTGFSIRAVNTDTAIVKVIVSANEATLTEFKGKELEIKARHGGVPYFSVKFAMNNPQAIVEIPKANFPAGIAAITLSDDQGRPHCERLVYIDSKNPLKITVTSHKAIYAPKERVVINVKATDAQDKPVKAELSLAAVDASLIPQSKSNILSYYMLESELKGSIENPQQYFDYKNPERNKQLDFLLMTQGWRDFIWKRLRDTSIVVKNLNETGFTISGNVTEKNSSKPIAGAYVTLFANGAKGGKLFSATTNAVGKYYFDNINLEGNQVIKISSSDKAGKRIGKITVDSLYSAPYSISPLKGNDEESSLLVNFKAESGKRKVALQKFSLSDTIALKEVTVKGSKHLTIFGDVLTSFGYPDQNFIIKPSDHTYNSLSHYLLTNVSGAMQSDDPGNDAVMFMSDGKKVYPTFIVDKRQDLFQRMDYYNLGMDQIEKITVRHMIGSTQMGIDSISGMSTVTPGGHVYLIYLTLKPGAFEKKEFSLINTTVNGYYQQRLFYSPVYTTANANKTDLRTTLFWNPMVKTDENGSGTLYFYNADPKSKIRIDVQGVSEKGVPMAGSASYDIK